MDVSRSGCRSRRPFVGRLLTPIEIEVLRLISQGCSNKDIAVRLSATEHSAKSRVKSILAKLDANDRTHAVMIGLKRGIIHLS